jgi:hypothetical protein
MDKKIEVVMENIDCACLIYGDTYDWGYVEKLYHMLQRNLTPKVRLHVFTEADRVVPDKFIKHSLPDLGIKEPKQFWWYKICLFNPEFHQGPLLYFDLDTVIVRNIDWIWKNSTNYFWALRDFKCLWRPLHNGVNTSVMWWDTNNYAQVWQTFQRRAVKETVRAYHGDQDFVSEVLSDNVRRFLDMGRIKSWRWQSLDGGYDFKFRTYREPGTGAKIMPKDSILIFHGKPKPDTITDPVVLEHWKS